MFDRRRKKRRAWTTKAEQGMPLFSSLTPFLPFALPKQIPCLRILSFFLSHYGSFDLSIFRSFALSFLFLHLPPSSSLSPCLSLSLSFFLFLQLTQPFSTFLHLSPPFSLFVHTGKRCRCMNKWWRPWHSCFDETRPPHTGSKWSPTGSTTPTAFWRSARRWGSHQTLQAASIEPPNHGHSREPPPVWGRCQTQMKRAGRSCPRPSQQRSCQQISGASLQGHFTQPHLPLPVGPPLMFQARAALHPQLRRPATTATAATATATATTATATTGVISMDHLKTTLQLRLSQTRARSSHVSTASSCAWAPAPSTAACLCPQKSFKRASRTSSASSLPCSITPPCWVCDRPVQAHPPPLPPPPLPPHPPLHMA